MKKLIFLLFTIFMVQLVSAQSYNDDPYGYDDPYRTIVGLTNVTWNGGASDLINYGNPILILIYLPMGVMYGA